MAVSHLAFAVFVPPHVDVSPPGCPAVGQLAEVIVPHRTLAIGVAAINSKSWDNVGLHCFGKLLVPTSPLSENVI